MPSRGVGSPLLEFGRVEGLDGDPSSSIGEVVKRCEVDVQGSDVAEDGTDAGGLLDRVRGKRGRE